MAIKKRGNDVKAKVEETKRKKKSREEDEDEEDEEDEEDDDSDDEEEDEDDEDEDDEKPVKKKGKKEEKKKGKKKKDDDDEDEEDQDDDDVYTGAYVKKMMKDPNSIPPGNYEFEIKKVRLVKGTKEKPWGGYFINVKVIEAPEDVDVPEDGWPTNLEIRFMTHIHKSMLKKDEKNKGSLRLNKSNFSRLLSAALGEIDDDETYDIKSLKGCTFGAEVVHSDKGYQNFRNFHAVEG